MKVEPELKVIGVTVKFSAAELLYLRRALSDYLAKRWGTERTPGADAAQTFLDTTREFCKDESD